MMMVVTIMIVLLICIYVMKMEVIATRLVVGLHLLTFISSVRPGGNKTIKFQESGWPNSLLTLKIRLYNDVNVESTPMTILPIWNGTVGFDPDYLLKETEKHKVNNLVIVGDAFAKPIRDSLDKAKGEGSPYDISSVNMMISSGVMWSSEVKEGLLAHHEMLLVDAMGSTEGGMGSSIASRENPAPTAKFTLNPGVIVITDEGKLVEPGSGEMGLIGTSGLVPEGYYKDEKKSAETFKEVDGVRYSFPGDYALVEADGSITLLGRGSNCINTAGEKVYPEEVEEAVKRHPDIYDCLVVGVEDDRFGQRVVALASFKEDNIVEEADLISFTRDHLAGYKLPKQVLFVDEVMRAPNGKANYKWAKQRADEELS